MKLKRLSWLAALGALPVLASEGAHSDPAAPVVLWLAVILVVAKVGGHLAVRLSQPAVLGELLAGVALGNLSHLGVDAFVPLAHDSFVDMFARVGVIILLFEVGLESTVAQMMKVGASAALVALVGVFVPFGLGFFATRLVVPSADLYVALFIGATLTATSVGITARVLKDLGVSQYPESRIILGAAVIDDVLGLVILAVVTGLIGAADKGEELHLSAIGVTLAKAVVFLVASLVLGRFLSPRLFHLASRLRAGMVLLALSLAGCFSLAWLADFIGLAPIVGAFAAGLILEDVHYEELATKEKHTLEALVHPLSGFLVPVFFVLMGVRTDLAAFAAPGVLTLASVLCAVAIIGKLVAGVGAQGKGLNRVAIGIGMVPRGEVGLIFASIGSQLTVKGQRVIDEQLFSAVVLMVIVTTLVTPPLLKWSFKKPA